MSRQLTRVLAVVMAGTALSGAAAAGAGLPATAAPALQAARASTAGLSRAAAVPGAQLWARRYNGPFNGANKAQSVAVSPRGGTVFVTGYSSGNTKGDAYATVAYRTDTGARLWASLYNGPGNGTDSASTVAVGPDGRTVFVTGSSAGATAGSDYATVAYDAATGAQLWASRYDSPGRGLAQAYSLAVSANGRKVYVTGASRNYLPTSDYATVAYDAATGAQLWASRYDGPAGNFDAAHSVAVSLTGGRVFVTGASMGVNKKGIFHLDYATVAYSG